MATRIRVRLMLEPATPKELHDCLSHLLAQSGNPQLMALAAHQGLALRVHDLPAPTEPAIALTTTLALPDRVEASLAQAQRPLRFAELRQACRIRAARLGRILHELASQGRIQRTPRGYQLVSA